MLTLLTMAPTLIALRTDKAFAQVKAWVEKEELTGFAVREVVATNEHWHWLLRDVKARKLHALRVKLTRSVSELSGNGAYSMTECRDVEKYERYLCKGESEGAGVDVAWRHSLEYSDDWIESHHRSYWEENKRLKKKRSLGVMDHVIDAAKRQNVKWDDRKKIAELYIRELAARSKPINTYAVKSAVNGIQVQLCPDDGAIQQLLDFV